MLQTPSTLGYLGLMGMFYSFVHCFVAITWVYVTRLDPLAAYGPHHHVHKNPNGVVRHNRPNLELMRYLVRLRVANVHSLHLANGVKCVHRANLRRPRLAMKA